MLAILFAMCVVLSAAALSSCNKNENTENVPDGMVNIAAENAGYSFYVPTTWKYTTGSDTPSAYYSNNDASNVSVMSFTVEYSDYTVDDWWNSFAEDFEEVYEGYELISSEETVLGGVAAVKKVFKGTLGELEYEFLQVSAIRKEALSAPQVVVFTYTSIPDAFEGDSDDGAKMIENFKFS